MKWHTRVTGIQNPKQFKFMKPSLLDSPFLAAPATVLVSSGGAAEVKTVQEFIATIKNPDDAVRGPAWQNAGLFGATAVTPLGELLNDSDAEIARAAKRALWKIVRNAGRPGAVSEQKAVTHELVGLLTRGSTSTCHEVLWMLSEIGGDQAVPPVAPLLLNPDLREDARAALQRIPGRKSLAALAAALETAPTDYKNAIAVSLRARGRELAGYPSQKLVPTKTTEVKPLSAA
jgi:HEAT repeat protein